MKKGLTLMIFLVLSILVSYWCWLYWPQEELISESNDIEPDILYTDSTTCKQILVGVQVEMRTVDYRSEEAFYAQLDKHLHPVKDFIRAMDHAIIVFPEHIGTWLVAADERSSIYNEQTTITKAMLTIIASHPLAYKLFRFTPMGAADENKASTFRMKARQYAKIYQRSFSHLAKEYDAFIVAGSIVLPEPTVKANSIKIGNGLLYNCSFNFRPDGTVDSIYTRKVYPILDEQSFCAAGKVKDLSIVSTPSGSIATLICADSWYPESYDQLRAMAPKIIAVPSYSVGQDIMSLPWQGYNGHQAPDDVDQSDILKLTEEEAWDKYALSGRLSSTSAGIGVNVFMRGKLWDMVGNGRSKIVKDGQDHKTSSDGPALLITCL